MSAAPGPSSVLKPYDASTDLLSVPTLIHSSAIANIATSNAVFLVTPPVVSIFIVSVSAGLYKLWQAYSSSLHLQMWDPSNYDAFLEEVLGSRLAWKWQDYVELVIYAMPILAGIIGVLYGSALFYHTQVWKRMAIDEIKSVDVRDVEGYYYPDRIEGLNRQENSSFWCLHYDNQVAACFGLDARNPGREVQRFEDSDSPRPALPYTEELPLAPDVKAGSLPEPTEGELDEDDDKVVEFLQGHSVSSSALVTKNQATAASSGMGGNNSNETVDFRFPEQAYAPLPSSSTFPGVGSASGSIVHLRHLSVSANFRTTASGAKAGQMDLDRISLYMLTLVIEAAFSASAGQAFANANGEKAGKVRIEKLVIEIDPKLEGKLRSAALERGFRIIGATSPTAGALAREGRKGWKGSIESIMARVWPLDFTRQILVLDRNAWEKQRPIGR